MAKLKGKRELFCREYIIDRNATQAAIRAGYSKDTAHSQGPRLLEIVEVKERIEELDSGRMERLEIDADYVLRRHQEIDELDVLDLLDNTGNMKPVADWPKAWRTSISGVDMHELITGEIETVIRKIKWPDKLRNLELLGKHVKVGAYSENHKHDVGGDLAAAIKEARERSGKS